MGKRTLIDILSVVNIIDRGIHMWSLRKDATAVMETDVQETVEAITFAPGNRFILVACTSGCIKVNYYE